MLLDGCLAHKTAVALAALSQYVRFIVMLTSAADHHLLSVNCLVEPYRLPQKTTVTVIQSVRHVERVPSRVGNASRRGETQQLSGRMKDAEDRAVVGHPDDVDDSVIDVEAKKIPSDRKTVREEEAKYKHKSVRGGGLQQDGDYDENSEVELDKDDFVRPRDAEAEAEVRQNAAATDGSLAHGFVAHPALLAGMAAAPKRSHIDPGSVRMVFKSHWFVPVFAVFLLMFWFRCMRCFRCGFLLRHCHWV